MWASKHNTSYLLVSTELETVLRVLRCSDRAFESRGSFRSTCTLFFIVPANQGQSKRRSMVHHCPICSQWTLWNIPSQWLSTTGSQSPPPVFFIACCRTVLHIWYLDHKPLASQLASALFALFEPCVFPDLNADCQSITNVLVLKDLTIESS
jgi:hypothetical protein